MSVFLKIIGAALIMLGVGLAVVIFTKPGMLDAFGIRLDTAALLLIGGVLANGQAGIMGALKDQRINALSNDVIKTVGVAEATPANSGAFVRKVDVSNIGAGTAAAVAGVAATAGAGAAIVAAKAPSKDPVADTISALEQAKADVIKSIGGMDATTAAPAPAKTESIAHEEPGAADEETAEDDDGLYVIEEKVVRGRPARVLSDDTVEAETDEGWMRFENMEHLNEYLDSAEEQSA